MRKHFKNALLIGSLLLSSTASVHAEYGFADVINGLAPTLPLQEKYDLSSTSKEATSAPASKYLAQHPFNMKTVKKVAGSNPIFTFDNMHEATDGAYILLHQNDLKSADSMQALKAVLQKTTDIQVILDVKADSADALNLYSITKKEASDGSTTVRRTLPYIKHLHLINSAKDVKAIGRSFLYGDKYIEDITFTGFESVEHIADGFMSLCNNLKSADLSSFEHLKTIGNCFMANAKSLTTLKLPTTRFFNADLTSVGDHFLRGATSLARIQEEALESVTHIGDYFMSESGVAKFDTGKFKKLKKLGNGFLSRCSSLAYVNVSGLNQIEPKRVTLDDATKAQAEVEKARLAALSMYKQAWASDIEAQEATMAATQVELSALKHTAAATASIKGTVAKGAERATSTGYSEGKVVLTPSEKTRLLATKEAAKATLMAAKDTLTSAEAANAAADHKLKATADALKRTKELTAKAQALAKAAENGQLHNLGLLRDCPKLKENPTKIKGAWNLLESLRNQLHAAYPGLAYEDDTCGC